MKPQDLCALICAHNEEATIAEIVSRTKDQVGKVFVLDDGSRDRTYCRAIRAGAVVIAHARNQGKGQALRTGFSYLADQPYAGVITLDADGQHLPEEIPRFAEALDNYDIVIGKRDFNSQGVPRIRRLSNKFYINALSAIVGKQVYDPECGFRAVRTETLDVLNKASEINGFSYEAQLVINLLKNPDLRIGWADISTVYIPGRVSKIKPLKHAKDSLKIVFRALLEKAIA